LLSRLLRDPFACGPDGEANSQGAPIRPPKGRAVERAPYSHARHWVPWEQASERLERADRYCSSPYWGVSLAAAFFGRGEMFVYRDGQDMAVFQEMDVEGGRLVMPCDVMWCLGCPIMAADPGGFLQKLCRYWEQLGGLRQVTISGPYLDNPIWQSPHWQRYPHWELPAAGRQVASLQGGLDGFLSRRTANFRSRLRRAVKKAFDGGGVEVEYWPHQATPAEVAALLQRAMRVEAASWKGLAGQGVNRGQMASFYRHMLPLLAQHGRLRGLFLTRDGEDLSYLFGARFADDFRGLQFSYLESETDSLGNVSQWMMLQQLVQEGCQNYDLGQAMSYKQRWAENNIASRALAFQLGHPA
jgi:hypothetical protein